MVRLFVLVRRRAVLTVLALASAASVGALAGAGPATAASTGTARIETTTATNSAALIARVVALVNTQRRMHSCRALTVNATLTRVAQAHTTDMAVHNYVSHNSRNGATPFDRIRAAGYRYSWAAENIAAGQTSADAVMIAWMRSPHHRTNVLNCHLTQIGVGFAANPASTYRYYWTQDFGTPR